MAQACTSSRGLNGFAGNRPPDLNTRSSTCRRRVPSESAPDIRTLPQMRTIKHSSWAEHSRIARSYSPDDACFSPLSPSCTHSVSTPSTVKYSETSSQSSSSSSIISTRFITDSILREIRCRRTAFYNSLHYFTKLRRSCRCGFRLTLRWRTSAYEFFESRKSMRKFYRNTSLRCFDDRRDLRSRPEVGRRRQRAPRRGADITAAWNGSFAALTD